MHTHKHIRDYIASICKIHSRQKWKRKNALRSATRENGCIVWLKDAKEDYFDGKISKIFECINTNTQVKKDEHAHKNSQLSYNTIIENGLICESNPTSEVIKVLQNLPQTTHHTPHSIHVNNISIAIIMKILSILIPWSNDNRLWVFHKSLW